MATYYNITGYQGDHIQLTLNIKDSHGLLLNLSGYEIRGQVKSSFGSTGILLNLNPIITNYTSGIASISIDSNISKNLPIGDHIYDVERYPSGNVNGNSIKLLRGKFSILPEVTR